MVRAHVTCAPVALLDLDGTLIDSIELILASYRHACADCLGEVPPDEVFRRGLGTPLAVQFGELTSDPALVGRLIASYREHNLAHHDSLVRAYPGAREALLALRAGGVRLGVVTSKSRASAERGLALCGMAGLFETLVCAEDSPRPKPSPEPVRLALERLSAPAGAATFAGDSLHDLAAGRAAGVRTAACLWGPFGREELAPGRPDHWLRTPSELTRLWA